MRFSEESGKVIEDVVSNYLNEASTTRLVEMLTIGLMIFVTVVLVMCLVVWKRSRKKFVKKEVEKQRRITEQGLKLISRIQGDGTMITDTTLNGHTDTDG